MSEKQKRSVYLIAEEIRRDWPLVSSHAWPYLKAMMYERCGLDSEEDVINRFLCNAQTWRG